MIDVLLVILLIASSFGLGALSVIDRHTCELKRVRQENADLKTEAIDDNIAIEAMASVLTVDQLSDVAELIHEAREQGGEHES